MLIHRLVIGEFITAASSPNTDIDFRLLDDLVGKIVTLGENIPNEENTSSLNTDIESESLIGDARSLNEDIHVEERRSSLHADVQSSPSNILIEGVGKSGANTEGEDDRLSLIADRGLMPPK